MRNTELKLTDLEMTRRMLAPYLVTTPLHEWRSPGLQARAGSHTKVLLKLELFQHTGSFKPRGALSVMLRLPRETLARGVTTVSAGNHAIATAFAARLLRTTAKVVMLPSANAVRIKQCLTYGAEVLIAPGREEAYELAAKIESDEGRALVHPFDGPLTALGTATIALELIEQAGELDAVVAPIGGGGLAGGIGAALAKLSPRCRLFGVEPQGADIMRRSLEAGRAVGRADIDTIADSLAPPYTLPYTYGLCRNFVEDIVLVSDDDLRRAMAVLFHEMKLAVEPAGAAAAAALFGPLRERLSGLRVAVIICGSNIDIATFADDVRRGSETENINGTTLTRPYP